MPKSPSESKKTAKTQRKVATGNDDVISRQLPGAFTLLKGSLWVVRTNWKVCLGIMTVYSVLSLLLVQSLSGSDVNSIKTTLTSMTEGPWGGLISSLAVFAYMAGSTSSGGNSAAGAYQFMLLLITSLAIIWVLRQAYANKKMRVRDSYYKGMYPLVTFLLVFLVVMLQLLPAIIGSAIYSTVTSTIGATGLEMIVWGIVLFLSVIISLYLLTSSLIALYVVCLPDMTPLVALRSARELVRSRRWTVMRKIIFLPIFLSVVGALLIISIIFVAAPLAPFALLLANAAGLVLFHSYMYRLYRELL